MTSSKQPGKFHLSPEQTKAILNQLISNEENKTCADCSAKGPRWASWNLGVLLCIRCSGIHRSLGVHISRVKSLTLDTWTEEQVISVCSRGNGWAKEKYEANLPKDFKRPVSDQGMEHFIRDKYDKKKFSANQEIPLRSLEEFNIYSKSSARQSFPDINGNISSQTKHESSIVPRPKPGVVKSPAVQPLKPATNDVVHKQKESLDDLLALDPSSSQTPPLTLPRCPSDDFTFDFFQSVQPASQTVQSGPQVSQNVSVPLEATGPPSATTKPPSMSKDTILSLYSVGPPYNTQQNPYLFRGSFPSANQPSMVGYQAFPQQQPGQMIPSNMSFPPGHGFSHVNPPQASAMYGQPATMMPMQQFQYQWQQQQMQAQMQNMQLLSNNPMQLGASTGIPQAQPQPGNFAMQNAPQGSQSWNNVPQLNGGQTLSAKLWK